MELMLAKTGKERDLSNPLMAAELKADGTHVRVTKDGAPRIFGRPKKDGRIPEYTNRLPLLMDAMGEIPSSYTIVGEAVVYDESGRTWFEGSQRRCSTQNPAKIEIYKAKYPIMLLAFDVTELDGQDLTQRRYTERKDILFDLLKNADHNKVKALPHVIDNKLEFFQQLVEQGEEGVILKRLNSTYQHIRSKDWLKVKKWDTERLKVVGWTPGKKGGKRDLTFGSLVLAKQTDNGALVYRGKVGSGFNDAEIIRIFNMLQEHKTEVKAVITDEDYTPVDIPLEVTVKFFEETKNGVIRFPSMLKDERGKNVIHFESTIFGDPQTGPTQTNLSALFSKLKKEQQ